MNYELFAFKFSSQEGPIPSLQITAENKLPSSVKTEKKLNQDVITKIWTRIITKKFAGVAWTL